MPALRCAVLLLVCASLGCRNARYRSAEHAAERPASRPAAVALAPATLLRDLDGAVRDDEFREGVYVGNIVFSGGYVTEEHEVGLQNVSKAVAPSAQDRYADQVRPWVDARTADALRKRRIEVVRWDGLELEAHPAPQRVPLRGTYEDHGHDNVNLPRFALEPTALDPATLDGLPAGVDGVVVPVVVHYYSHNAGWFVGQTWGTGAGTRFRVLWTLYDASTGRPAAWTDITTRFLHDAVFQPSSVEVEDFMLDAEEQMARQMARHLLR